MFNPLDFLNYPLWYKITVAVSASVFLVFILVLPLFIKPRPQGTMGSKSSTEPSVATKKKPPAIETKYSGDGGVSGNSFHVGEISGSQTAIKMDAEAGGQIKDNKYNFDKMPEADVFVDMESEGNESNIEGNEFNVGTPNKKPPAF